MRRRAAISRQGWRFEGLCAKEAANGEVGLARPVVQEGLSRGAELLEKAELAMRCAVLPLQRTTGSCLAHSLGTAFCWRRQNWYKVGCILLWCIGRAASRFERREECNAANNRRKIPPQLEAPPLMEGSTREVCSILGRVLSMLHQEHVCVSNRECHILEVGGMR